MYLEQNFPAPNVVLNRDHVFPSDIERVLADKTGYTVINQGTIRLDDFCGFPTDAVSFKLTREVSVQRVNVETGNFEDVIEERTLEVLFFPLGVPFSKAQAPTLIGSDGRLSSPIIRELGYALEIPKGFLTGPKWPAKGNFYTGPNGEQEILSGGSQIIREEDETL